MTTTTEQVVHEDGRTDVTVHVNKVDVPADSDAATLEAARVINEEVIPALQDEVFHCVLLHKPTGQYTQYTIMRRNLNAHTKKSIYAFYERKLRGHNVIRFDDFALITFSMNDKKATCETPMV